MRDELETTKDNLDYVQDRIKSGQNDIMALMETKPVSGVTGCTIFNPGSWNYFCPERQYVCVFTCEVIIY